MTCACHRLAVDVLILGGGFAGSILGRCLVARGRSVVLVERSRHPRFALGESTTPLGNLALERLAQRYGLDDLDHLAAWGRLCRHLPALGRGKKRGFTFYGHHPAQPYRQDPENRSRLLVAASPDDEIADTHWLRADVDAFLFERARSEGVVVLEGSSVTQLEVDGDGARARVGGTASSNDSAEISARFVIDATGGGGALAGALGLAPRPLAAPFESRLLYGHFRDLPPFSATVAGLAGGNEPYPEEWAAVHHLLDVGWMYQLRFDHAVTSAGFLLDPGRLECLGIDLPWESPADAWRMTIGRFPSLVAQFETAQPVTEIAATGRLQRRLERAAGERWALLPATFGFQDPLFSFGIAWSLVAVERLAELLGDGDLERASLGLERYGELLGAEADHLETLIGAAYSVLDDFPRFRSLALLYFVAASFDESRQRLLDPGEAGLTESWCWQGFLGATDPVLRDLFLAAAERASTLRDPQAFKEWVRSAIAQRNIAGLGDPARRHLYPVDEGALVENAGLLGLDAVEARRRLPRLRGRSR